MYIFIYIITYHQKQKHPLINGCLVLLSYINSTSRNNVTKCNNMWIEL